MPYVHALALALALVNAQDARTPAPVAPQNAADKQEKTVTAAPRKAPVTAEPGSVIAGQSVRINLNFTAPRVVASGGKFGRGTPVAGKTFLTDAPKKTTKYTLDVYYKAAVPNPKTGKKVLTPEHVTYSVVVTVLPAGNLKTYAHPRGWQVRVLNGWKCDSVPLPDPANNGLFYFQQQEDSVERLAVSILPASKMTCSDLMQKVLGSLYDSYDNVEIVTQSDITHAGQPAILASFLGTDRAHRGVKTQSLVLTFVQDGRAYIVSARTGAANYKTRQQMLETMIHSFAVRPAGA